MVNTRYLHLFFFRFVLTFIKLDEASEERILKVLEKAQTNLKLESQKEINAKYREYLLERGKSIHTLNRNPSYVSTDFSTETTNLKRSAEDASYPYAKQARFEAPAQQQQPYGYAYPQQGQTQQQQPYPTGGYYGQ